jgi:hypothetical protein
MPSRIKRNLLCERNLPHARLEADDARVSARLCALVVATALVFAACDAHSPSGDDGRRDGHAAARANDADDAALPVHAEDVVDYTLRATLDPAAHTVHGEGAIRWRNASTRPVRELWLHLYLNAFKNERSAYLRERVGGRGSAAPDGWGWIDVRRLTWLDADGARVELWPAAELRRPGDDDETDVRVPLPRDVAPGEGMKLEVVFDDTLPSIVERTGYRGSLHVLGQWFPKLARLEPDGTWAHFPFHHLAEFYADFGTYDVTLDVPSAFVVGATGPRVESRVEHGRRIERHVQGDVHDFAWTAWDTWRTLGERVDGVDVEVLYPPGFDAVARRDLAAVRFALPYESSRYGRYPYAVLTVAHVPEDAQEAGGMEYPTFITSEGAWFTPAAVRLPEIVTVHELGHQWFYGLVATDEAAWPFLDEGVNQFAETDAMGAWLGDGSALDAFGLRVSDTSLQLVGSEGAVHDEPVAQPASAFSTGGNYGRLVYARTAAILETLARVYGRDAVARALGTYARRYRFRHPGPDDFVATFAETMGAAPAALLRGALFDRGWVDFSVESVSSEPARAAAGVFDRDGGRVTVARDDSPGWEGSALVRRRGTLTLPVDVDFVFADGSRQREHWDGAADSVRIPWHGPVALRAAVVDPDDRVAIDANLENNRCPAAGEGQPAWRTFERTGYWMQLALDAVSP